MYAVCIFSKCVYVCIENYVRQCNNNCTFLPVNDTLFKMAELLNIVEYRRCAMIPIDYYLSMAFADQLCIFVTFQYR